MKSATLILAFSVALQFVTQLSGEEVIWRYVPSLTTRSNAVPDNVESTIQSGNFLAAEYLVSQIFIPCGEGIPRVGLPGTVNHVTTFFRDDSQVDFDLLPNSKFNPDTGQYEIPGLATLNVFVVPSQSSLPSPNDNPDNGFVLDVVFSQNKDDDWIEVKASELIKKLPTPLQIQPNTRFYIGLTPIFFGDDEPPFSGLHFTNPERLGFEQQSAVRMTAPDPNEWTFAGDTFGPPKFQVGTIEIKGPPLFIIGDVNGDNLVSLLDVQPFVNQIMSNQYFKPADINGDGFVNLLDVAPFVDLLSGS